MFFPIFSLFSNDFLFIFKGNEFLDAKESKMRDMESNGDMFGNSKGVGKWDPELKAIAKNKKLFFFYFFKKIIFF